MDFFALSGRICENSNCPDHFSEMKILAPSEIKFRLTTYTGFSIQMAKLFRKKKQKFKFSQLLPGSEKCSMHLSKSETPLP
jgi:hypothetical protein